MATWAEQPFQLIRETGISSRSDKSLTSHPAYQFARVMALTHNAILRALNALYNQCLYIKPGTADAIDFLFYCQCFVEVLQGHHKLEDDFLFVELKRISGDPTSMDQNLQEHQDFEVDLDKFRQYVFETHADAFDGEKVKTLLDGFGKALEKHLHREIPTLIDLHVYDQSALQKVFQEFADRGRNEGDKYRYERFFSLTQTLSRFTQ